jgi:hypothetical protein
MMRKLLKSGSESERRKLMLNLKLFRLKHLKKVLRTLLSWSNKENYSLMRRTIEATLWLLTSKNLLCSQEHNFFS